MEAGSHSSLMILSEPARNLDAIIQQVDDAVESRSFQSTRRYIGNDGAAVSPEVINEDQLVGGRVDTREEYSPPVASRAQPEPNGAQIGGHRRRSRRGEVEVSEPGLAIGPGGEGPRFARHAVDVVGA